VVHPGTLIEDRALAFGDWAPRNFDRRFHGAVTAAQALQMSLNLPAVAVLDRVGARRFASTLAVAGAPLRLPASDRPTGLAIGLGGGALGLADLVALYAAIADDGGVAPLRVLAGGPGAARLPVLSADAARAVFDILVGAPPTDGRAPAELLGDARRRAIKTGTSYGFRDAWAIGASRRHVVGVWVGRPDGTPSPGHYGRAIASPILNRVFDRLPPELDAAPSAGAGRFAGRPPPALARFGAHDRPLGVTRGDAPLVLTFPPAGAEFAAADIPHLGLRADGGRRPLRWLVDGRPLAADQPWRRETRWIPDGPGFYRLSVIDAEGASASATIRIH
jgi:penicillin-binding protein 1C